MKQRTFTALGLGCVGLGTLGIFVPGLPTTCFLLLASWLFSKASPRWHRRLREHRILGDYLRMAETRTMPWRAKVITLVAMWAGITASWFSLGGDRGPLSLAMVAAGLIGTCALLIWTASSAPSPTLESSRP